MNMQLLISAWYSARIKPKHEHIATASIRKHLGLEVFFPRLRVEKITRRGLVRVIEPLFPGYIFVRCIVEEKMNDIRHTTGVSKLVQFGDRIPKIEDHIIQELRDCFAENDLITVENHLVPGDEIIMAEGAFAGMPARVLRSLPARQRVQVLLEILGRPTLVEVAREAVVLSRNSLADLVPFLAANPPAAISPV
jgi:transcriptional antiterminator RfaH